MPSKRRYDSNRTNPRRRPWEAKVQLQGCNHFLGSFLTRMEAYEAEERFKRDLRWITWEAHRLYRKRYGAV